MNIYKMLVKPSFDNLVDKIGQLVCQLNILEFFESEP
jgi:hypothetical protein